MLTEERLALFLHAESQPGVLLVLICFATLDIYLHIELSAMPIRANKLPTLHQRFCMIHTGEVKQVQSVLN